MASLGHNEWNTYCMYDTKIIQKERLCIIYITRKFIRIEKNVNVAKLPRGNYQTAKEL